MITFEEYKKHFGEKLIEKEGTDEFLKAHYCRYLEGAICNYFDLFKGEMWKDHSNNKESLYNWCITLETIFSIKTERNGTID